MSISQGGNKNGSPLKSRLGWTSPDFCRGKLNDPHSLVVMALVVLLVVGRREGGHSTVSSAGQ